MVRRPYIDWLRGVAVLLMIAWHSIDAWIMEPARDQPLFKFIVFCAGWPAPLFLLLAGVAVPLAGAARMARGASRVAASRALQVRGWQVFLLAHVFRLQSFLLNPHAEWNSLFKADILNILGLGVVLGAVCWERAISPQTRARWLIAPAAVTVLIAPFVSRWSWPALLPPRLEGYIRVVGDNAVFSLIPSVAYVLAGVFLGLLVIAHPDTDTRFFRRLGVVAAVALAVALIWGAAPASPKVKDWVEPISLFIFRVGAMLLAFVVAWLLFHVRRPVRWRPLVVFGRTSLFVYWVHVELAYGVFSYPLHHALTLSQAATAYLLFTAVMFGAATLWLRRPAGAFQVSPHMAAPAPTSLWRVAP